jgi:hypothetical protein
MRPRSVHMTQSRSYTRQLYALHAYRCTLTPASWFREDDEDEESKATSETADGVTAWDPTIPQMDVCEEWKHVWPELSVMLNYEESEWSDDQHHIRDLWNARVGMRYARTSFADLHDFHESYPLIVPQDFLENMVSDFEGWPRLRDALDGMNSTICTIVEVGYPPLVHATSLEGSGAMANISDGPRRRWIQPDIEGEPLGQVYSDPTNQIPALGRILDGIRIGR